MRDGNNVDYDIDSLTSKCGNAGGKTQKGKSKEAEMVRVNSHTWLASSAGAYWNTTEKMKMILSGGIVCAEMLDTRKPS